jgi:DNA-directed RNA polymerase subunit RPC12/RpoP
MAKGFCSACGREVGTFLKPSGYQCKNCLQIYCFSCSKKIGFIFKSPVCPNCGIVLVDDVRRVQLREEHRSAIAVGSGIEIGRRRAIEVARQRAIIEQQRRRTLQDLLGSPQNLFGPPPNYRRNKKKRY